jgi:hypothetical protein
VTSDEELAEIVERFRATIASVQKSIQSSLAAAGTG